MAPVLLSNKKVKLLSRLNDFATYLYVSVHKDDKAVAYAAIEVPSQNMPRFVVIPPEKSRKKKYIMLLDDIIRLNLDSIFKGFIEFDNLEAYSFKMTRDSEYSINDEINTATVGPQRKCKRVGIGIALYLARIIGSKHTTVSF